MSGQVTLVERPPTPDEYAQLRAAVGWRPVDPAAVEAGLADACYSVCAMDGEVIVGCARIVGDGAIYLYLQDVIVLPEHQGRGIGRRIMDRLMAVLETRRAPGCAVQLMAASGVAGFYEAYGFRRRDDDRPGMFLDR